MSYPINLQTISFRLKVTLAGLNKKEQDDPAMRKKAEEEATKKFPKNFEDKWYVDQ